ncbi:Hypothetical Protein FCC1311_100102 [Hondaea fermentalgiana]|uniref:Uncharacterized protein n=1 Tax=Hondaea fermentalgiana TaxID=2315210 RepID=A0A2R5GSD0_9STRA|nr:Hypothetical Protein FCC1311_100102 [Hondaea fermentalgiana]|eukprot:GBG33787.1 Hypothetical Protein FCC1311_100102 [Hondaea fermentalgiana]
MLRQTIVRAARVQQAGARKMSTQAAEKFPLKGMSEGGHPQVLQRDPPVMEKWFNAKASPEILPIIGIVGFALGLATYKTFVVDGMSKPFVKRL